MSFAVNVHELFWLDLAEARIYYESISFDLGDRFYEVFEKAYQKLIQNPQAYFNLSKKVRRLPLPNFPVVVQFEKRFRTKPSQKLFIINIHEGNCGMTVRLFKLYHYQLSLSDCLYLRKLYYFDLVFTSRRF